jgi:hypothetical protein
MYVIPFEAVSVSAAQDLFEVAPADDKIVILHALHLSNVGGTADAGDAQEELLQLSIRRGYTTSGSGGSTPNIARLNANDAAASFTAEVNNTTVATTGTPDVVHPDGFNVRVPYTWAPAPECRPVCSQAESRIVVRLVTAPADAILLSGGLIVEELP